MLRVAAFVCCLSLVAADQDKWVWGSSNRRTSDQLRGEYSVARPVTSGKRVTFASNQKVENKYRDEPINDEAINHARYEVFEGNGDFDSRPPPPLPPRPPPPPFPQRPPPPLFQSRPPPPLLQSRPPPLPPPGPLPPIGKPQVPPIGAHPSPGILTGPVPSWEHEPPFKNNDPTNFDHCKCVHSFNCKSPGLKFSSCDVGKTYCCYNEKGYGLQHGSHGGFGASGRPGDGPALLVGPGGPNFDRPGFNIPLGNRPFPLPPGAGRPPFLEQNLGPIPFDYLERSSKPKKS